jgi:hypothetical protein
MEPYDLSFTHPLPKLRLRRPEFVLVMTDDACGPFAALVLFLVRFRFCLHVSGSKRRSKFRRTGTACPLTRFRGERTWDHKGSLSLEGGLNCIDQGFRKCWRTVYNFKMKTFLEMAHRHSGSAMIPESRPPFASYAVLQLS